MEKKPKKKVSLSWHLKLILWTGLFLCELGWGRLISPTFPGLISQGLQAQGGFLSENQFLLKGTGTAAILKGTFLGASGSYGRFSQTPLISGGAGTRAFYEGIAEASYQNSFTILSLDINTARVPQNKVQAYGGTLEIRFANAPNDDEDVNLPGFEVGARYKLQMLSSSLLSSEDPGKNTVNGVWAFVRVPFLKKFEGNVEVGNISYSNSEASFYPAVKGIMTSERNFVGASTFGNLKQSYLGSFTWHFSTQDSFKPLYQFSVTDFARQTAHTLYFEWNHFFSEKLFMTPAYETTFQGEHKGSCFLLRFSSFL